MGFLIVKQSLPDTVRILMALFCCLQQDIILGFGLSFSLAEFREEKGITGMEDKEKQRVIIHDLSDKQLLELATFRQEDRIVNANRKAAPCVGCFGCWLKTPGICLFKDELQTIGAIMGQAGEIIVISRACYGGYSPEVKRVFDRSVASSIPFFTYRAWRIHHPLRYHNTPSATVYLYGEMSDFEKDIARGLVKVNQANMGWKDVKLFFAENPLQIKEVWQ